MAAEACRAVAADRYRVATVQSAEAYRANALAEQQRQLSAEQARADADRSAAMPVIVGTPAPQQVSEPTVTIQQPASSQETAAGQHLAPLPALGDRQPIAATDMLKQMRANGAAAEALKSWPTADADMPFAAGPMAMVVNGMPRDDADLVLGALEEAFDLRPSVRVTFMRALTQLGRQAARATPTVSL
jgi:hypothetical protein